MFKGIVVNDETLAVEIIRDVGPGGNYLSQHHTRQHMRKRWQPALMDRRSYDVWEQKKDGARDWAREKAQQILEEYHPEPLDIKLQDELQRILTGIEKK
jgi:trimethylamine--corrinoid protein Co-methyltransferase